MTFISPPSTLPPGSTVWAYLRDSGGEGQDRSVERQEAEVKAYCQQYGLSLVRWFRDIAKSGGSVSGRSEFEGMIDIIATGAIPDGVLLWNFARFARNLEEAAYYKAFIRRAGVVIHSLTDPIPEGAWDRVIETIIDISNEEKRRQTSRDVKSELRRLVQEHGAIPGTPPKGFKRIPLDPILNPRTGRYRQLHRWDPDTELVPVIQRAYQLRAQGATLAQIHEETGGLYAKNSWAGFFQNKLYKGVLEFGDLVIENYCVAVVSPELWEAANLVGRKRARRPQGLDNPRRLNSAYLFTGLVYCQECGQPMNGNTIKGWMYYACSRRKRFGQCSARRLPARALHDGIIQALIEQVFTQENLLALQKRLQEHFSQAHEVHQTQRHALERQLATAKKEIKNLTGAIRKRGHSLALLEALDQAEIQKAEIEQKLSALKDAMQPPPEYSPVTLAELAERIRADLTGDDDHKKRLIIRAIITRIIAKRTDDKIMAAVYYIPPQKAITPDKNGGNGDLGLRGSAPTVAQTEGLISVEIPVKRHKAPVHSY